jgi:hypothetical protein
MNYTRKYFELKRKIENSDYKLHLLSKYGGKEDILTEEENNKILCSQFAEINEETQKENPDSDKIRISLIYVANGILNSLNKIKEHPIYYPDLNQGLVIPGYLFSQIIKDFEYALKSEGDYFSVSEIYVSDHPWNYDGLLTLIKDVYNDLNSTTYNTNIEAIEFYDKITKSIIVIIDELREKGQLYQ